MKKFIIGGMSCMNCVKHVKGIIEDVQGVTSVEVNLNEKYALVQGDFSVEKVIADLKEDEYDVLEVLDI